MSDPRKQAICNALAAFIAQKPGLDPRDYISGGHDARGRAAYAAESRAITRDLAHARTLLEAVRGEDAITADMLLEAAASGGRLTITGIYTDVSYGPHSAQNRGGDFTTYRPDWCTGQYWSVEYRRGTAAFLAGVLWAHVREHGMPAPEHRVEWTDGTLSFLMPAAESPSYIAKRVNTTYGSVKNVETLHKGKSAGDWLRDHFRRRFGKSIAERYFN